MDNRLGKTLILNDIRHVGITKLLGYLPLQTIRDQQVTEHQLIAEAENRGLKTFLFTERECCVVSGALYVADLPALQLFLTDKRQESILCRHKWPVNATKYVHTVISRLAPPGPLYDLVALTFGDKRPEYQHRNPMVEVSQLQENSKQP